MPTLDVSVTVPTTIAFTLEEVSTGYWLLSGTPPVGIANAYLSDTSNQDTLVVVGDGPTSPFNPFRIGTQDTPSSSSTGSYSGSDFSATISL